MYIYVLKSVAIIVSLFNEFFGTVRETIWIFLRGAKTRTHGARSAAGYLSITTRAHTTDR